MRGAGEREKQVVKRNATRGSDQISASMRAVLLGAEGAETAQSWLSAECDVCAYGVCCPDAGVEMRGAARGAADDEADNKANDEAEGVMDVTRGYDKRECSVADVLGVWKKCTDARRAASGEVYLKKSGRGRLRKCVCCEVCVHAACAELPQPVLHSDDYFDCGRGHSG